MVYTAALSYKLDEFNDLDELILLLNVFKESGHDLVYFTIDYDYINLSFFDEETEVL